AAKQAQGWTPSGRFSSWDDLEYGMKIYREAGGTNAVLANCSIDLAERPQSAELAKLASVNFICPPEEARRRIKRVEAMGFEEILIGSQLGDRCDQCDGGVQGRLPLHHDGSAQRQWWRVDRAGANRKRLGCLRRRSA